MTLGGLALAVGILVDDATVAIENISQNLEQGKELEQAILDGTQQIAVPTLVSTLSICIVFIPMFLLAGVAHYLLVPLAEAVVFAMLASYFFSRTLIPTLAKYLLRHHEHMGGDVESMKGSRNPFVRIHLAFERHFEAVHKRYRGFLEAQLDRPGRFASLFLMCCLLSLALAPFLGRDFFPSVDSGVIALHLRTKTGTRIEETAALTDRVDQRIRELIPRGEIHSIIDNMGLPVSGINLSYNNTGTVSTADADVLITLSENHKPTDDYIRELRKRLPQEFPDVTFSFLPADITSQILNFGLPAPIDIAITGRDVRGNRALANHLLEKIRRVPGLVDARIQQPSDLPAINVEVDRTKALQAGFTQRDVANNLLITLSGSQQTTPTFWLNPVNGVSHNVITSASGKADILGALASLSRGSRDAVVYHYNPQTTINLYATTERCNLGAVSDDVQRIIDHLACDASNGMRGRS